MTDQAYMRDHLAPELTEAQRFALVKLGEEAAELAKICMKTLRWGFGSYNPLAPEKGSNLDQIAAEFNDVIEAFSAVSISQKTPPTNDPAKV